MHAHTSAFGETPVALKTETQAWVLVKCLTLNDVLLVIITKCRNQLKTEKDLMENAYLVFQHLFKTKCIVCCSIVLQIGTPIK